MSSELVRCRGRTLTGPWFTLMAILWVSPWIVRGSESGPGQATLAAEVRHLGWIAYGARASAGDWDLFLCRPNGEGIRPLTRTAAFSEFSPQFSPDGRYLLYRRIPTGEVIDNNRHGEQGSLVIARSDGSDPRALGTPGEFPWASWSPDGSQIACLTIKGFIFVEVASGKVLRQLPRKGFFQQVTWSPDGQWLCGVANSYGTGWSIARLSVATGEATPVNTVDCCTPDWFPSSQDVIFSWRPPGQKSNQGYGWTQLWRASADGRTRQLVYAEDGRHVYGGHVSPDGRYVVFTGNLREDGDPSHAGAPMALMRLADAPVISGDSAGLRAAHPGAKEGPVLTLPVGWEPAWTASAHPAGEPEVKQVAALSTARIDNTAPSSALAAELHSRGWLAFSAKTARGDWDLFLMRPDGTDRRQITDTPDLNEAGVRFSPDGRRVLYYQMPKTEPVDNNTYGTYDLVIAYSDGSDPVLYGREFPWASWGPGSNQVACLTPKGIQIVDLASRAVLRQIPRRGIVEQLVCSPDGEHFVGTANGLGPFWNIGCLELRSGDIKALSETERYNCTPDWAPDSKSVLYARGIIPEHKGRAELWMARIDAPERRCLYAEPGRHIYGACPSPDGRYLLFTRSVEDLGKVVGTELAAIRWPTPEAAADGSTPRLDLGPGWEPHWTLVDVGFDGRPTLR